MLKSYLFRKDIKKNEQTINLLGYSSLDLRDHIESKFDKNMTWENYGREVNTNWSIDHTTPISSATTLGEVKKLNHYTNLQPLCSKINRDIKKNIN